MNRTESLPMVALRGMTILPEMVAHFDISRERSIEAVQEAMASDQKIFLLTQKDVEVENPGEADLYRVGTVATVKQIIKLPKQILRVLVSAEERAVLNTIEFADPYLRANITIPEESDPDIAGEINREAMMRGPVSGLCGENAEDHKRYGKPDQRDHGIEKDGESGGSEYASGLPGIAGNPGRT